jgi:hypothetical protein
LKQFLSYPHEPEWTPLSENLVASGIEPGNPRAGLDAVEKRKFLTLPELELRPLGRPAYSQSLYRLGYPGSWKESIKDRNKKTETGRK